MMMMIVCMIKSVWFIYTDNQQNNRVQSIKKNSEKRKGEHRALCNIHQNNEAPVLAGSASLEAPLLVQ